MRNETALWTLEKVCSFNHSLDTIPGCEPNEIKTKKMKAAEHICSKIKSLSVTC